MTTLVSSLSFLGRILWMLGYPDQALTQSHQALALAQERARPEQLATILYQTGRAPLVSTGAGSRPAERRGRARPRD